MSFIGKNIKQNTLALTPQSTDPVSPVEGMLFRSDGTSREAGIWEYRDSQWIKVGSGSGAALNFIDDNSATFEGSIGEWSTTSYRKTVAGSSAAINTLTVLGHAMPTDTQVIYREGSTPIVGLTSGDTYFVINVDPDEVQLSLTQGGSAINISTNGGDGYLAPLSPIGLQVASTALSLSLDSSTPLNGSRSLLLQKDDTENGESEAFLLSVDIPEGYKNRQLALEFIKNTLGTNDYTNDDYEVYIKDENNNFLPLIGSEKELKNDADPFKAFVYANDSDTLDLIVYVKSNITDLKFVRIDDVKFGPADLIGIPVEREAIIDLAGSGDFTGGSIRVSKTGKKIVISSISSITYSSSANPQSAVGIIPDWARPEQTQENVHRQSTVLSMTRVTNTGRFEFDIRTEALVPFSSTSMPTCTISYTVPTGEPVVEALAKNSFLEIMSTISNEHTPNGASGRYNQLSNNSIIIKKGKVVELDSLIYAYSSGAAGWNSCLSGFWGSNGDNTSNTPVRLNDVSTIEILSSPKVFDSDTQNIATISSVNNRYRGPHVILRALEDTEIFLVTRTDLSTPANGRVRVAINAKEIPFSQTALFGMGVGDREFVIDSPSGHGSTDTAIRNYSLANIRKNTGQDFWTPLQSAANGLRLEILKSGNYVVSVSDTRSSGSETAVGFSVNATALTTGVQNLSYAQGMRGIGRYDRTTSGDRGGQVNEPIYLNKGDIVRHHSSGANDGTGAASYFKIKFMGY